MSSIVKSTYSQELWDKARDLIVNKPDVSLVKISQIVGIPLAVVESKAVKSGWLNQRDIKDAQINTKHLNRVIQEVALQINDVHQHTSALVESLQYAHRIKIVKDKDGTIHYINFEEYPGRPKNWKELTPEQQEVLLRYIAPSRFSRFMADLLTVLSMKNNNINFISKMIKGSLPKVDPSVIDLSRRDSDNKMLDGIPVFELDVVDESKPTEPVEKKEE